MAYIPPDAKWYLAEVVLEMRIDSEPENVVHTNVVLVRADSPEDAYRAAIALGRESEMTYTNPDGKRVQVYFRGLRDLNVIHGELEHGTELTYYSRAGMSEPDLEALVSSKDDLGVFKPRDASYDRTSLAESGLKHQDRSTVTSADDRNSGITPPVAGAPRSPASE